MLTLLRHQKEEERLDKSLVILKKLFKMKKFKGAWTILFYASAHGEVDTFEMIKRAQKLGKKIGLPRIIRGRSSIVPTLVSNLDKDLKKGPYGIKQPKESRGKTLNLKKIDMVIVPGLAFDRCHYRLGRGAGYYDRFLKKLPSHIPTIGLAFDFQIIKTLPQKAAHDVPVSQVVFN